MSEYLSPLIVRELDDKIWELTADFLYKSDLYGGVIKIPAGFPTDFASVPRIIPIAYALLGDRAHRPAAIHDWLYACQALPRELADKIIKEAMALERISPFIKYPIYWGVKIGGQGSWNEDKIKMAKWRLT
jgi:hypothetical protein